MNGDGQIQTDVVVIGLGLGAVAAALAATGAGCAVVMAGGERRVGGQITTQLTAPLDEHPHIEREAACSLRYRAVRDSIRAAYDGRRNPGGGWVSRLCFEPAVGERILETMLDAPRRRGMLTILRGARLVEVIGDAERLAGVVLERGGQLISVTGAVVVDATETGDVLPLAGADWVIGSEGRAAFGEPHALPGGADHRAEQSCTVVAALVRDDDQPGPVADAPLHYERWRDAQPFSLTLSNDVGHTHTFSFFDDEHPPGSFWSYRRVRDSAQLGGIDAAIINWHGNDWYGSGLVADPRGTEAAARDLTRAFVHWLRTEAPRDGGGTGYPELRLAPEISGTSDGLAESPYVRESRRLRSAHPVTELDLTPRADEERAEQFTDAAGIAWYHADLHPRVGGHPSVYAPTAPFQVPLRSLVPECGRGPANLLAGAKNLAATQIAAAAYRVHHGEWAVGEAAGVLAAHSVRRGLTAQEILADARELIAVQGAVLRAGVPIVWALDLPQHHPAFVAGSLLIAHGGLDRFGRRRLTVEPDLPVSTEAAAALRRAAVRIAALLDITPTRPDLAPGCTWGALARALAEPALAAIDRSSATDHPRAVPGARRTE